MTKQGKALNGETVQGCTVKTLKKIKERIRQDQEQKS